MTVTAKRSFKKQLKYFVIVISIIITTLEDINLDVMVTIYFRFVHIWRYKLDYKFIVFKWIRHQAFINNQKLIHTAHISIFVVKLCVDGTILNCSRWKYSFETIAKLLLMTLCSGMHALWRFSLRYSEKWNKKINALRVWLLTLCTL